MENKEKEQLKFNAGSSQYGKRDYYFHADEDFREDHEWGKIKSDNIQASPSSDRISME